jgi:hypothetical protein
LVLGSSVVTCMRLDLGRSLIELTASFRAAVTLLQR